MSEPPRRVTANAARKPDKPQATDNPNDFANAFDRWRTERQEWKDSADPVVIVDIDLPLSSVFALAVQIGIIWIGLGAIGAVILFAIGVL